MKKINSYMGFAKRSGNLIAGAETCIIYMKKKKVKLLVIAEDAAENSKKKLIEAADRSATPYRVFGESEELSHAIGSPGRTIFGILKSDFADSIQKEIDNKGQYERRGSYDSKDR